MRTWFIAGGAIILSAAGAAWPAQSQTDPVGQLDELAQCRRISDDSRRLACFDRTSAAIVGSRSSGALVALDRETVKRQATARFGLGAARRAPPPRESATISASVDKVSGKVASVKPSPVYGRYWIGMDNGMTWETIGAEIAPPSPGEAMAVARNAFGAYRATIGRNRSIQVKRIR